MSHVLRAAVAATSLFSCPACVTTGSPARTVAEPAETATAPTAVPADAPAGGVARWWRGVSVPAPDVTAALVAWEQAQTAPGSGRTSMTIEPGDSRLRLVLGLMDPTRGPVATGASAGGTNAIETSAANQLAPEQLSQAAASIWSVPPALGAPEVLGLTRVALNRPPESAAELFTRLLAEPRNTPEPGTLALAGLGLCGVAVQLVRRARAT